MFVTRLRFAFWAALCILITLAGLSCDALNPSFISQLGGDAGSSIPAPSGSIVVVFNNQRTSPFVLSLETETTLPGSGTVTTGGHNIVPDSNLNNPPQAGYFIITLDCNTTMIRVTGIAPMGATATQPSGTSLTVANNEFRAPALQCGSVLFVNIPVFGSPTAELVP